MFASMVTDSGRCGAGRGDGLCGTAAFTGRTRTRAVDVVELIREAGAGALGIVAIVNGLVGAILAFVGAVQLQRFGAGIYVADLVGVAMAREMAGIGTAIVMAGRTGGAYAAHLATMQGNEEIDALNVFGIPIFDFLVLPRITALVTMMPLLYIYGCAVGFFGGALVSIVTLDITPLRFLEELRSAVTGTQFAIGFTKSIAFGALVALAGCFIGLRAGRSAADVGHAATAAVVVGIVGVIVLDAVFAVCCHALGIDAMISQQSAEQPIEVRNLTVAFGGRVIQRELSFSVRRGSIFAIMGGSGCGKSTVLKAIVGLLRPSCGAIRVDGEDYWAASDARRAEISRRFGVLFQSGALWSSMTVAENVALPLQMFTSLTIDAIAILVQLKLSLVGLAPAAAKMPAELSGGMLKRAALARALALDPEILLFDEPSAGLDPITSERLDELILELKEGFGATVVVVSHELASLFGICDDGVFLDAETGTAIAHGSPRSLRDTCENPTVRAFMQRKGLHRSLAEGRQP